MDASTARACLRRLSPLVNSVRIDQATSRFTTRSGALALLTPPLVDGLLGENPARLELQAGNAPLGGERGQRALVDGQVPRCLVDAQHVLRGRTHGRSSLSTVLRSVSSSASSVRIRSTSCSSALVTGSGRSV